MSLRKRVETSTSGSEGENNLGSLGSTLSSSIVEMFGGKKVTILKRYTLVNWGWLGRR